MKNLIKAFFVVLTASAIVACSDESDQGQDIYLDGSGHFGVNGAYKIYTLPAPLQVATALKSFNLNYREKLLVPVKKSTAHYLPNYLSALNMGIYGIDLGYATIYEQHQTALNYLSHIQKIMDELGIESSVKPSLIKSFEANIKNQDSLYSIILRSYDFAHQYFQENEREELGLLILTGSFIEGLYLTTKIAKLEENNKKLVTLIGQQKQYLENIIELLQTYRSEADILDLLGKLTVIQAIFNSVQVTYAKSSFNQNKLLTNVLIADKQLTQIGQKINEIRNLIIY